MRKVLALLLMLGSASAAFGFDGNDPRDHRGEHDERSQLG